MKERIFVRNIKIEQDKRGDSGDVTVPSPNPTFKKHVESAQNIVGKYSQTLCRCFCLYGFSMLL